MGFGNMLPSGFMKLEVTGRCTIPKHDYIQRRLSFNQKIHTKATRYTSDTKIDSKIILTNQLAHTIALSA